MSQIDHTAVDVVGQRAEGLGPGRDGLDLDVVVPQQLDEALAFDVVVLDDEQTLLVRRHVGLDAIERRFEVLGGRRLDQVRERAMGESVLPLLLNGDHLHGNVTRRRVELETVEDGPPQHVG